MSIMEQNDCHAEIRDNPHPALFRILGAMVRGIIDHYRLLRAESQLRAMTDHQLRDVGLTRAEIHQAVRGMHRQDPGRR